MTRTKNLNVVELFAGVGGFRLGFEAADLNYFNTVWANQWEPGKKVQHAFNCYAERFKSGIDEFSNTDISTVPTNHLREKNVSLIAGGFPCQDYSVARSLSGEQGIQGKKGVLFWEIQRLVEDLKPKYVLLENVDRLIKSPASQRGRDFAVMLAVFRDFGYDVEWRVINAAEYGNAQRRRRVFIFAYRQDLSFAAQQEIKTDNEILFTNGFFASTFPVKADPYKSRFSEVELPQDVVNISEDFSYQFFSAGIMKKGKVTTTHPETLNPQAVPLRDILEENADESFYLTEKELEKFAYLRGSKKIERTSKDGYKYIYSEGGMSPTDDLNLPGRTMLTSESSVNRSTHIININGRIRYLTPVEAERLNGFPDNWTEMLPLKTRYFVMGNALVVDLVKKMANKIKEIDREEKM